MWDTALFIAAVYVASAAISLQTNELFLEPTVGMSENIDSTK